MTDWQLVHLFVPILLPVLFLCVLRLFPLHKAQKARANPLVAIKDGQLSWVGLGMCVNALYEFRHPAIGTVVSELWSTNTFWLTITLLLSHAVIAAYGPVFPTPKSRQAGFRHAITHYRVLVASALLTIGTAKLFSDVHFTTQGYAG